MYSNQIRTNTKYTDFLRSYYHDDIRQHVNNSNFSPPDNNNVTNVEVHRKDSGIITDDNENFLQIPQDGSVIVNPLDAAARNSAYWQLAKTKFAEIFSAGESNALRAKLQRDKELGRAISKHFSDTDLLRLHATVKASFDESSAPDYAETLPLALTLRAQSEKSLRIDNQNSQELRELEADLQRVNAETLQALASATVPEGGGENGIVDTTSYRELLKAEHVALRRELLNNIRQLSRATYQSQEFYPASEPVNGTANGVTNGPDKPASLSGLTPGTADPKQRIDEWIRNSQEHINDTSGGGMYTSLFHDAVWNETPELDNEQAGRLPQEGVAAVSSPDTVKAVSSATAQETETTTYDRSKTAVITGSTGGHLHGPLGGEVEEADGAPTESELVNDMLAGSGESTGILILPPPGSGNDGKENVTAKDILNSLQPQQETIAANAFLPTEEHGMHRRFSKFTRAARKKHLSGDHNYSSDDSLNNAAKFRSYSYTNVNKIKVFPTVAIIPQPTLERYPDRIFKPKENYSRTHILPRTDSRLSGTFDLNDDTVSIGSKKFSKSHETPKAKLVLQAEAQTGYIKNQNNKNRGRMPGILRRQNMDQWVAKKVYFFVNGDEHTPKLEYRFRPFRDVKTLDALCDILSNRLKLSHGVRHIFTIDGELVESLDDFKNEHFYVASSSKKFKVIHYGRGEPITQKASGLEEEFQEFVEYERRSRSRSSGRRPPSAPSTRKPPVIRIRKDRSLNGSVWGSPQQLTSTSDSTTTTAEILVAPPPHRKPKKRSRSHKKKPPTTDSSELAAAAMINRSHSRSDLINSGNHLRVDDGHRQGHRSRSQESRRSSSSHETLSTNITTNTGTKSLTAYAEEAEKFVQAAIEHSRPIQKQIIRIINGYTPTIQSQVLLNTKTTQPWDELVRDLGMAVKLLKGRGSCMETISGRKIQSYSQLRTELMAGNLAFYIYPERDEINELGMPPLSRNTNARLSERTLGKAPAIMENGRKSLPGIQSNLNENSHVNRSSTKLNTMGSTGYLNTQLPQIHKSYEALPDTETKYRRKSIQPLMNVQSSGYGQPKRYTSVNQLDTNGNAEYISATHLHIPGAPPASSRSNPSLTSPFPEQVSTGVQTLDVPSKKRNSRRRRSEASVYLASASRSRSISPP